MKRRRYWPWSAVGVALSTAFFIALFFVVSIGEIALHRWDRVARLVLIYVLALVAIAFLIRHFRSRFDYFLETDGKSLRIWSPSTELTLRVEEISAIEWRLNGVVVRAPQGEIAVTRKYAGYAALRKIVQGWDDERKR